MMKISSKFKSAMNLQRNFNVIIKSLLYYFFCARDWFFFEIYEMFKGRFHVTFSLRWTEGHRFRSNISRAFVNQKKVSSQNLSSKKKNVWRFNACFIFCSHFLRTKTLLCIFCYQRLRLIVKNFEEYIIDVKFLKESIYDVRLATRGSPNLKMPKNRFFFIIRYLICCIFVIFLCM